MADTMTITETTADGTTTVIEIAEASDDSTLIEDVIEALSDDGSNAASDDEIASGEIEVIVADADENWTLEDSETTDTDFADATGEIYAVADATNTDVFGGDATPSVMTVDEAYASINDNHETGGIGMTVDEAYASLETGNATISVEEAYADLAEATAQTESAAQFIPEYAAQSNTDATTQTQIDDTATNEAQAHIAAAADAQTQADEFVAAGDYAAAADAREAAENEAYAAENYDALHGSSSIDLTTAATGQENAAYYEQQQAAYAEAGDYEAASDAAGNAAQATGNADWSAGGEDHTGQAKAEEFQMDYAAWEQSNADYYSQGAADFAADGNLDAAADFAESAGEHQTAADYHGDLGGSYGVSGVYDDSSAVEAGGSYSAPVDYSSNDADGSTE